MRPTIAIDVDGVLAQWKDVGWNGVQHFGDPIPGAVAFVATLAKIFDITIWTARCTFTPDKAPHTVPMLVDEVRQWLNKHGFVFHHIWSEQGKPLALFFVDDRAIMCQPEHDPAAFETILSGFQLAVEQEV